MTYEQTQQLNPVAAFFPKLALAISRAGVTSLFIAMNVMVFVLMALNGVSLVDPSLDSLLLWGADYGPLTMHGQWWRILTSTFVHVGPIHLVMNMVVLWMIGSVIEPLLGRLNFTILYLLAGVAGSLTSLASHPYLVSAGASGAVFGVFGVLLALRMRQPWTIPQEALTFLSKYGLSFLIYNLLHGMADSRIDMAAHIGGLAAGFLLTLPLARPVLPKPISRRNVSLAVAACGAILAAMWLVQLPVVDDLRGELLRFGPIESKILAIYADALTKAKAGQLSDEEFAQVIEKQILPPWTAEVQSLSKLRVSGQMATVAKDVTDYMTMRGEAWSLYAKGAHASDTAIAQQANEKWNKANDLASKMGSNKTSTDH